MKLKYGVYLLLACLLFCILCNPLPLYFLSDDFDSMYAAQTWSGVIHSYRPGSDFLLHTDHLLYGYNAGAYHITNYLLHFLTTYILFFTAKQLLLPFYSKEPVDKYAFAASLIFLFYPFHSECIFWLVGRSSLLATMFAMASIYCWLRKKESNWWYVLSLICLMLGLFSYESIWTLPAIIIILSFVYDKGMKLTNKLWYTGGYWLIFFSYLAARFYLTNTVIGSPYGTQKVVSFDAIMLLRNLAYLIIRSFAPPMESSSVFMMCAVAIAAGLSIMLYKTAKHMNLLLFTVVTAYFVCLLPVVPFGIDTHYTESERFLYMPSAFLAMLISIVLFILFRKKIIYAAGSLLLIQSIFLAVSYQSFAAASRVTKATVQSLQTLRYTNSIYCIGLPGQYKGGFIFRNGIVNAARLFAPAIRNVSIVSQKELFPFPANYIFKHYPVSSLPGQIHSASLTLQPDTSTAIFVWTDSALNIYR